MSSPLDRRRLLQLGLASSAALTAGPLLAACGRPAVTDVRQYAPLSVRPSFERGTASRSWLEAKYSFSFSRYRDPAWMGFRSMRVLNEDRIAGGGGFPMHGHEDMEIVTWVLDGALEHRDSLGNGGIIQPGLCQRMSAGTGIRHSEINPAADRETHLLQIWFHPDRKGHDPGYEQKQFDRDARTDRLRLVASPDGADGSISLHQDVRMFASVLSSGARVSHEVGPARHLWLQVARGVVEANGQTLASGDAAYASSPGLVEIRASSDAEVVLFDLA